MCGFGTIVWLLNSRKKKEEDIKDKKLRINYNINIKVYCHWTDMWFLNYCVVIELQKEEKRHKILHFCCLLTHLLQKSYNGGGGGVKIELPTK